MKIIWNTITHLNGKSEKVRQYHIVTSKQEKKLYHTNKIENRYKYIGE